MTFTIGRAPLTVTAAAAAGRQYNGSTQVDISALALDGIVNSDDVSAYAAEPGSVSDADVGTYDLVTLPTIYLTGISAGNYTLTQPTAPVPTTVSISKADAFSLTGNATMAKNQANYTVELDLTRLNGYPAFPGGTPVFAVTSSEPYNGLTSATTDASGKLTLVADNSVCNVSDAVTIFITSMGNYTDSDITVTVNYTDKTPVAITGVAALNGTYNGTAHAGYTGTPSGSYTGTYEIVYTGRNGTAYNSTNAPVNAGDYTVTFKVPDGDAAYSGSVDISFTIAKATITAIADSKSITTGGTLPSFTVSYTGLVAGDTAESVFSTKAIASCTADGKTAGRYDITVTSPVLTADAEKNYIMDTSVKGFLTVSTPDSGGAPGGGAPDGSLGNSVTVPLIVSSGTRSFSASVIGNTATVSVSDAQLKEIASGSENGTLKIDLSELKADTAVIPAKVIQATDKSEALEVALPTGTVSLDKNAMISVENKGDIKLSVETLSSSALSDTQKEVLGSQAETALVIDINLYAGGSKISTFGDGRITVSVPYTPKSGENTDSITVWFIKDDGTIEPKNGMYNAATGCVEFITEHLSLYLIVSFPFADVTEDAWYYGSVAYAYNNGLFAGTGTTTFSPETSMTRQMIWMVLARLDGKTPADMDAARAWAMENVISDGTNPTTAITREQLATILCRYAKYKGYDVTQGGMSIREFTDYGSISEYALTALGWSVNAGLIQGSDNNLMPAGSATRAQVATILQRFCHHVAK
ncbi:MAG: S-layer homology domain-containing protein [Oscillospiraceae bacterium]|nr:S-layer homology domain-containing protein [Oscillospiraceae bacterium]